MTACLLACSAAGSRTEEAGRRSNELAGLLRFANYVQTLDEHELERQHEQLRATYEASPSSDTAIKLSLLLSRPGARPAALAEALTLLTDTRDGRPSSHAELGWLLYHQISARYLTVADNAALSARLGEAQARGAGVDTELAAVRTAFEAAEGQRVALVQQLDALKAIEERINSDGAVRSE